jgi:hypothetical protein
VGTRENVKADYKESLMDYVPGPIEAIRNSSLPKAGKQTRPATVCRWNGFALLMGRPLEVSLHRDLVRRLCALFSALNA